MSTEFTGLEIAVIGMAGRFPGAKHVHEFWENLKNGVESISFFSRRELEEDGVDPRWLKDPDYVEANGILAGNEYFDSDFFDYTPREADIMDPQMRVFHECAWGALEDAGYCPDVYGGLIGLYAGATPHFDWEALVQLSGKAGAFGEFAAVQLTDKDFLCLRVSYRLNLKGPAVIVQTACSTSLVAIHTACQAILNGECDMALAGGVTVTILKKSGYFYQEGMILSPGGHCRAFDAKANGTVNGNGAGIVVLKRLEEAIDHGDHIYAVVKGSAVNNDGIRKVGFTAPSIEGQAEVIIAAQQTAEVEPQSITYIETHGTGTELGDPVEFEALTLAFHTDSHIDKKGYCATGSVKTNVGHLDSAAGAAGFIKAVLAIYHRLIPPSLHFENPNPKIDLKNSPFYVNTGLQEWENNGYPLRAGISSFGLGGTNAHVIIEEAPADQYVDESMDQCTGKNRLILLSAKTQPALNKMTDNLADHFRKNPGINLADTAYTLQMGRKTFPYRKMSVCSGVNEAIEALTSPGSGKVHTFLAKAQKRTVVFMFSGQGAQYVNMGLDLYRAETLFHEEMDRCTHILESIMGENIKNILYPLENPGEAAEKINDVIYSGPIKFSFEYCLAKLLMKWGIRPHALIGHSFGEYAAACLAGVFSLEDALELVALRGRLMKKMPDGIMMSVPLPEDDLRALLTDEISLAAVNTPSLCIVSGPARAVEDFENQLNKKGYDCMHLNFPRASHSKMMTPISMEFAEKVRQKKLNKPQIPYISGLTGTWITPEQAADPVYWAKHLIETVRFSTGIEQLLKEPNPIFVQPGSDRGLPIFVNQHEGLKTGNLTINLVRHPKENVSDVDYILKKIGLLWLYGAEIDWPAFHPAGEKRYRISLPTYPFEPVRYPIIGDFSGMEAKIVSQQLQQYRRNDIADWFYIPQWHRSVFALPGRSKQDPVQSPWLVFMDDHGLGDRLVKSLPEEKLELIFVKKGETFGKSKPNEYTLAPGQEEHYEALFHELQAAGCIPGKIIHLWNITGNRVFTMENLEDAAETGFYSLIWLVQAIGKSSIANTFYLDVITDNMQEVTGGEGYCPQKAVVLGPVKVIPREYPNIKCRSIDIQFPGPGSAEERQLVERLLLELTSGSPEPVIALRGNYRWLQTFEPVRLEKTPEPVLPLKEKGVYLVTGGLGGIGLVLAEHLVKSLQARVILTGRSAFPEPAQWRQWLDNHDETDSTSAKIRKVQELEALGGEVMIFSADAADKDQMQAVIRQTLKRFGRIHGVIHSAGLADGCMIQHRSRRLSDPVLAPKIRGTVLLDTLLQDQPPDFFVMCSSLSSFLVPFGQVGYGSANAFLDAFAHYKNNNSKTTTISINWGTWQGVGMGVEIFKQLGKDPHTALQNEIFPSEGVDAFERIMDSRLPQVAVSIRDLQQITDIPGELGLYSHTSTGEETWGPPAHRRPDIDTEYIEPGDELEQTLAGIFRDFLGIDRVGIDDNFFELGISSLDLVHISSKLKKMLKTKIPVVTMFTYSTIRSLAQYLEQEGEKTNGAAGRPVDPVKAPGEHDPGDLLQNTIGLLKEI